MIRRPITAGEVANLIATSTHAIVSMAVDEIPSRVHDVPDLDLEIDNKRSERYVGCGPVKGDAETNSRV